MRRLRRRYGHAGMSGFGRTVSARGLELLRDHFGMQSPEELYFGADHEEMEKLLEAGFLKVMRVSKRYGRIVAITRKGQDEVAGPFGLGQPNWGRR
jgi:hypothetical protein